MTKKINEEKVQPLLIYPENLPFLKREVKLPHSSNEIMNTLRARMGGSLAFEKNPIQGTALYGGLLILCIVAWIVLGFSVADYFLNFSGSTGLMPGFRTFGLMVTVFAIFLGGATWILAKTLFSVMRYSPDKMRKNYALMLQQGKPVRGTLISEESVNGTFIITYQFSSPDAEVVTCTYRSLKRKYKKGEAGKTVIIWYMDNTFNTML